MSEVVRWLAVARERAVVLRALKFALVVGAVLIAINHGDALLMKRPVASLTDDDILNISAYIASLQP